MKYVVACVDCPDSRIFAKLTNDYGLAVKTAEKWSMELNCTTYIARVDSWCVRKSEWHSSLPIDVIRPVGGA